MSAPLSRALANSSLAFYLFPVFYFGKRDIYGAGVAIDKHFPQNYTDYCFCQTSGDLSYESGMTFTDKTLYVSAHVGPKFILWIRINTQSYGHAFKFDNIPGYISNIQNINKGTEEIFMKK